MTTMSKVPIIDIRAFLEGGKDANPRRALDTACRDHGFFLLTGHGMDDLIDAAWAESRAFFASPKMLKRSVERSRDNALGYFDRELTKQKRDRKEVFDFADDNQDTSGTGFGRSRWPQDLPEFRDTLLSYSKACAVLTNRILVMLYTTLGLSCHDVPVSIGAEHTGFVRLNHYPVEDPVSVEERDSLTPLGDMALHHHTDPGVITLLLQDDVGGLQGYSEHGGWDRRAAASECYRRQSQRHAAGADQW